MKISLPPYALVLLTATCLVTLSCPAGDDEKAALDQQASLDQQAADALRSAVAFFTNEVATEGGFLWQYSDDLAHREGEGRADDATVWVQPPGTPTVGEAILDAYAATGETIYLEAARKTGMCLVRGQLVSGGWGYSIHFRPEVRKRHAYRIDLMEGESPRGANVATLDDDTTQAALRFLMRLDRTLDFTDRAIHDSAMYALDRLLAAQYPNGAWPQRFSDPPNAEDFPVKKAAYPASWSREHPRASYGSFYTLNDNTLADMIDTMLLASAIYGEAKYREAAVRGGEFIILAQMPDPQPAWAQQYDHEMHPAWARRFEPPAVTGGESQGAMRALMAVCRATGDRRFLEPIPRAIAYLRNSRLSDGRLARFYELETNRPLYFTKDYQLTYEDGDMPTHYSFKTGSGLDAIEREYERLAVMDDDDLAKLRETMALRHEVAPRKASSGQTKRQAHAARDAIATLDARGRWVEPGELKCHDDVEVTRIIRTSTFIGQ
ncbi:MAG: pectate lyase, partial [Patescibacteria group bacterium]|nr:pectate lyase [Patescibacteria group bacterium]